MRSNARGRGGGSGQRAYERGAKWQRWCSDGGPMVMVGMARRFFQPMFLVGERKCFTKKNYNFELILT